MDELPEDVCDVRFYSGVADVELLSDLSVGEAAGDQPKDFLFTCGERSTVKIFFSVGRGMGPVTTAPVLRTVFTIFSADLSTRLWS